MFLSLGVSLVLLYFFVAYIIYTQDKKFRYKNLYGKHVVVTGGSSGIGKAAAIEAARLGAHITIIGRDVQKLERATKEIFSKCLNKDDQIIQYAVCDVTGGYEMIDNCFSSIEEKIGPIFMLVNCAGACICGLFENMKIEDIKSMISLNYFGSALPTRWVLSKMRVRNEGIIVFVASEAAMIGIYGYSAYSAGKWAVRGLAEAVSMELVGTKVRVMISYPPDTDTPGLKLENTTKPVETKLISGSGGLHSADKVGKALIHDAMAGKTYSTYSTSGKILNILYGPSLDSVCHLMLQIMFSGFLRAIIIGIFASFHSIIRKHLIKKRNRGKTQ